MKELPIANKEIRCQVKLLKTEFAAMNSVYCEVLEFITGEHRRSILNDIKNVLTQDIGETKIREYLLRNADRMSTTRLEWDILQVLKEKK
jgi:uncharacterized membrane protein